MNRIILIAFLAFAIPQITFAAWWNPASWFKKTDAKIQTSENKIKESEDRVNNSSTTIQSTKPVTSNEVKLKIDPTTNIVAPTEDLEVKLQVEAQLKIDAEKTQAQIPPDKTNQPTLQEENTNIDPIDILTNELKNKVFAINQQIVYLRAKYLEDVNKIKNHEYYSDDSESIITGRINILTDNVNLEIEKLKLKIEQLDFYYRGKIEQIRMERGYIKTPQNTPTNNCPDISGFKGTKTIKEGCNTSA